MESLIASAAADPAFSGFQLQSYGSLVLPDHPIRFGFQVDIVPDNCPTSILFGLVSRDPVNGGHAKTQGFAVRVELEMREVWDALNGSGLVGWVEHPNGLAGFTDEEPLLLGWEIEYHGHALIPKLIVADQQWLYPAIQCPHPIVMETLIGWQGEWERDPRATFLHPALWREQLPMHSLSSPRPWRLRPFLPKALILSHLGCQAGEGSFLIPPRSASSIRIKMIPCNPPVSVYSVYSVVNPSGKPRSPTQAPA